MSEVNGYFRLVIDDSGTSIIIYPPKDGGKKVDIQELEGYLKRKNVDFTLTLLRSAIEGGQEKKILLQKSRIFPVNEEIFVRHSEDCMKAIFRFYPPTDRGSKVTREEILGDMKANGIKVPLNEEAFQAFLEDKKYCTDYILAVGEPPEEGKDGEIKYHFNTDPSIKPTVNTDGSVDFFHLNTVSAVGAGQVVAELIPASEGTPGKNVFGEVINPHPVRDIRFSYGPNLHVSDNGLELISDIDGHIDLVDDRVFVSGVLELENIDTATGNIEDYEGNLLIKGNVISGFRVKASGDIEIRGVVEGAYVEAGGQITVVRGVNGVDQKGVLKAGKNVVVKYIENALVEAGENVTTECILNSNVTAGAGIYVDGRRGFISGGKIRALKEIEAKIIGSDMGGDTFLEVGIDPRDKEKMIALQQENAELIKYGKKIQPVLLAMQQRMRRGDKFTKDQVAQAKDLSAKLITMQNKLAENNKELERMNKEIGFSDEAMIKVSNVAYAGTRLNISDSNMVLKTAYNYCRFVKRHGEVTMIPYM